VPPSMAMNIEAMGFGPHFPFDRDHR